MRVPLQDRDPRRHFSGSQRKALYERADGRCEDCSDRLRVGWQADHVVPWSHGGKTDLSNGRALCPYCNLARSDRGEAEARAASTLRPRGWQADMLDAWRASTRDVFVVSVAPGGGKTIASGFVAKEAGMFTVVVVPSRVIMAGFIAEFAKLGVELQPFLGTATRHGFDGVVVTYQGLGSADTAAALLTTARQAEGFLLVADEIHHAGDGKLWGVALAELVTASRKAVLMSGTPYREDRRAIPGVVYDDLDRGCFDFHYSYEDALTDGHVIPVRFPLQGGSASWVVDGDLQQASTEDWETLPTGHQHKLLNRLFSASSKFMHAAIEAANEELSRIRATRMPHAGGIIFCYEQADARAIAALVERLTNHQVEIIVSDDPTSQQRLDLFRNGDATAPRWLATCRMVSEGADVRRLRVAIWATLVRRSRLFFTQLVGRVQRAVAGVRDDYASVYLPDIAELSNFALSVRTQQAVVGFDAVDPRPMVESGGSGTTTRERAIARYLDDDTWELGEIIAGEVITPEERELLVQATSDEQFQPSLHARLETVRRLRRAAGPNATARVERHADVLEKRNRVTLTPVQRADLVTRLLGQVVAEQQARRQARRQGWSFDDD